MSSCHVICQRDLEGPSWSGVLAMQRLSRTSCLPALPGGKLAVPPGCKRQSSTCLRCDPNPPPGGAAIRLVSGCTWLRAWSHAEGGPGGGPRWRAQVEAPPAHRSLLEQSLGTTAGCADRVSASRAAAGQHMRSKVLDAFSRFRRPSAGGPLWLEVVVPTKSNQLVPYHILVNLVCGRDPTPHFFYWHNKCC